MKTYLPHWRTVLIGLAPLALVGIMLVGEDTIYFTSGKHAEKGWPLIYWKQDFLNKAAFPTRIGTAAAPAPPPEQGYVPKGEEEINPAAFWIDVVMSVVIVAMPMGLCEWFLRRRARRPAPTSS
jgi:hypothetical protein